MALRAFRKLGWSRKACRVEIGGPLWFGHACVLVCINMYLYVFVCIMYVLIGASCGQRLGNVLHRKWQGRQTQEVHIVCIWYVLYCIVYVLACIV